MKKVFFLFALLGLGSLSAQSFVKHFALQANNKATYGDSLRILAVLVEFQEDKYDATIGNGKFGSHYSRNYGDTILDPLPHDAFYFEDHLLFAKNYFKKVSKGKLNISYKVLPEVITVSKTMREYSPGYQSNDLKQLANFSEEVWKIADQKFSSINFSNYDLFIIFHAGVSSGLDLGTFSIDRNLPSLYLSYSSLKNILGAQFNGFPTKTGLIKNSMIMPETESRELQMIDNSVILLQLTINGTLVANIASHLGLPDLFDTETGKSAIGRFGLMDGQAMIANNGMFPPEPSAWEKIFLDWNIANEITYVKKNSSLTTFEKAVSGDTTIVKIPITSTEYFLLENRQQDANKNNLILTIKNKNKIYQKTIKPDTSGIFYVTPDLIDGGVVIDVDEFDAATPGNGIVIWHIDENIINKKIIENKINSDLYNKGVDVVEADGIQDIGEVFSSFFGSFIGEGEKDDFWFKGNKSKFYKNIFSPDSKPNSNSNSGAKSFITIENFSENKNKMSFDVLFGNDVVNKLVDNNLNELKSKSFDLLTLKSEFSFDVFLIDSTNLLKINKEGKTLNVIKKFSDKNKISGITQNGIQYVFGSINDTINVYSFNLSTKEEKLVSVKSLYEISTPILMTNSLNELYVNAGTSNGYFLEVGLNDLLASKLSSKNYTKILNSGLIQINKELNSTNTKYFSAISKNEFYQTSNGLNSQLMMGELRKSVLVKNSSGEYYNIILSNINGKKHFDFINQNKIVNSFDFYSSSKSYNFSVAELFNDGRIFIVLNNENEISVFNINGTQLENFPFQSSIGKYFVGTPLIVDLNKDGAQEILVTNNFGELIAINTLDGRITNGFPIKIANSDVSNLFLYEDELPTMGPIPQFKPIIIAIDKEKNFSVWQLSNIQGKSFWKSNYQNSTNNSFVEISNKSQITSEFFPLDKAYNWPNPVYDNFTNIRFYVSEDSKITIRIFDLAGELITTLQSNAQGCFENEIIWDVTKVQSGVYYANLQAESLSGKTASKIIKIAVIK